MIRRPPRSTLFPYTTALPIFTPFHRGGNRQVEDLPLRRSAVIENVGSTWLMTGVTVAVTHLRTPSLLPTRSEEHTSELQSRLHLVCRLLLEKKKHNTRTRLYR